MKKSILLSSCLFISFLSTASTLNDSLYSIEQRTLGRIGVSVLDSTDQQWHYKGNERFPMMSTFKTLACAKMLQDSDRDILDISTMAPVKSDELIAWSPITKNMVGSSITIENACEATMKTSDNTAANIVLKHIGGPQGVTAFLRLIGDKVTQLDRFEPELNQAKADDLRDTTTPNAMNKTLYHILFEDVLAQNSKKQLKEWMQGNTVSDSLLRSVLPKGWSIADRSGAGANGSRGITAAIWTDEREPLIISIYLTQTNLSMPERNQVINEIGKAIFEEYAVK
ncbi:TPA: GMA family class A beta-lactamase GMA-1 [Vibrio parahaemolyticus]|jgi:beta-lactamase class A|uniref:Beta-lactamase n=8 Tax=Gammaproteobacteria TaxID=1236 RepID=Q8RQL0_PHODP|nr:MULTISPECIES: GMA family class A beta-lactamase GMA-1 [Pseudomonadota]HDM8230308.1 class A beta-lactamase [Vibrio campbellii]AHJ00703.1 Beta-lactamase [Vibrio parahaemolyticus UCM-V493]ANS84419.1 Beta-lactamase [Vibrio scophthalmi]AYM87792.1 class A beta-lactamase [Pseudoalteromonas agarivorans]MBE8127778.1 class A beta-lactamase [Photobacterium damselae subsp. piscicida]